MTDQEKVIKLLDELNIKYEVNGNTVYIDGFECDGAEEFGISFWDGEDYPEGSYHEFWVVPWPRTLKSIPEVSLEEQKIKRDKGDIENPRGEWIVKSNGTTNYYACDKCGSAGDIQDKFCRECGAKMKNNEAEMQKGSIAQIEKDTQK